MDRLIEILAHPADLATLSDEDLAALRGELTDLVRQAREGELNDDVTALIRGGVEQVTAIKAEIAGRAAEAARIVAEADEQMAALDALEDGEEGGEPTEEGEGADEPGDAPAEEALPAEPTAPEEAAPEAPAAEAQPIAAAAAPPKPVRAVKVPARHKPRANQSSPSILATGEVRGVGAGHQFTDLGQLGEAMWDRFVSLKNSADGNPHYMGAIDYRALYPDEQRLHGGDPYEITDKIMRHIDKRNEDLAMVASGGVPGPAEPRYEQITFGQADRPVRDALPSFLASRGQIVFNQSPLLSDVLLDTAAGAIGTVTSAADLATATKDVQEISAPQSTTTTVEAETMRWQQGNFADRFLPERTRAFMKIGQVSYARHNDALRLLDIKNGSVKYTNAPAAYGAYRDLKRHFLGITEEIEDRIRDFNVNLRVLMPEFVPSMLAADLVAQQAGDASWNITEERVRADMQSWDPNVTFTFIHDSIRGRQLTTPTGQSPRSPGFDADVEWAIFPEGAWLFLDGGQLDLGIIRDSTLSATNKFQTFFESWEAVAQLVNLSWWVTSSLCANGDAQVATASHKCSPQGS